MEEVPSLEMHTPSEAACSLAWTSVYAGPADLAAAAAAATAAAAALTLH